MRQLAIILLAVSVAHAGPPRWVWIGDSTSACTACTNPRASPPHQFAQRHRVLVEDLSVPGLRVTADPNARALLPGAGGIGPVLAFLHGFFGFGEGATAILLLGVNDWLGDVPLEEFDAAYAELVDTASRAFRVVCVTPLWNRDGGPSLSVYRDHIAAVCAARGALVLDGAQAVPPGPRWFADGTHPTDRGSRRLAAWLHDRL